MQKFSSVHPSDVETGNHKQDPDTCTSVIAIICAVCCGSALLAITFAAFVVGFVGLAHTRNATLDPMCPPGYWHSSLGMLLSRVFFGVFFSAIASCAQCCCGRKAAAAVCTTLVLLCFVFSMTISNTTITAGVWPTHFQKGSHLPGSAGKGVNATVMPVRVVDFF